MMVNYSVPLLTNGLAYQKKTPPIPFHPTGLAGFQREASLVFLGPMF